MMGADGKEKKRIKYNLLTQLVDDIKSKFRPSTKPKESPNLIITINENSEIDFCNKLGVNIINYYSSVFRDFKESPIIKYAKRAVRKQIPFASDLSDGSHYFYATYVPYEGKCHIYGSNKTKNFPYIKDILINEERLNSIYESFPDPVIIHDIYGKIISVNQKASQLLEYKIDEITKMNMLNLYSISSRLYFKKYVNNVIKKKNMTCYMSIKKKNKEIFDAEFSASFFSFNKEKLIINTLRDTSSIIKKNNELYEKINNLSNILDHFNEAILLEGIDRKVIYINNRFCTLFKIDIDVKSIIKMCHISSLYYNNSLIDDKESYFNRKETLRQRKVFHEKEEIKLSDNRYLERDYIPIFYNGQHYANLWKFSDITVNKVLSNAIQKTEYTYHSF